MIPKYPKTPYWPTSPSRAPRGDRVANPADFLNKLVYFTEKLDGGCTLLHQGQVYARSVSEPSSAKWMAMVKKHHGWKVTEPDVFLYGEDLYGVHSIEYDPIDEAKTFYAFAMRIGDTFLSLAETRRYADNLGIPSVPVLLGGVYKLEQDIQDRFASFHAEPSILGDHREGAVLRSEASFHTDSFEQNVCKSVRKGHVQTDEHWTRKWKPCRLTR